jgi:hypothetical protein
MSGGANITNTEARIGSLRVQQSSQGVPIALLWGRGRVSPNLLWMGDFEAVESTTSEEVGKGGGTTMTNTTYTYKASMLLGLCAGECTGIVSVWRHKDRLQAYVRTLPAEQLSYVAIVPAGKVVTVPLVARWASTVAVTTASQPVPEEPITQEPVTDYTVAAGVYTFGATVVQGSTVTITYTISELVESLTAMQAADLQQFATGALGQAPWAYLAGAHPTESIAYSGLCYVAASQYVLGGAAGLPQLGFEVDGPRQMGSGNVDANPADIITDLVQSPHYGGGGAVTLASLANYRAWCNAAGLWLSPVWTERKPLLDYIRQLCLLTHAQALWSVDQLKIIPLATEELATGTGSYTPLPEHAGPVAFIDDSHLKDPIDMVLALPADRYNRLNVQYRARANEYAEAVESAEDKAAVDAYGLIERPEVVQAPEIAVQGVATLVAELLLREEPANKNQYRFTVPISFALLDPLDIVSIQDARIGLAPTAVRLLEISESENYEELRMVAEDVRSTGAVTMPRQAIGGFNYAGGAPGAVTLRAIMPPTALTGNAQELWLGVAAGDNWGGSEVWLSATGTDYRRVGSISARARMGTLGSALASASVELNAAQVLDVQLNGNGTFTSAGQAEVDALRSLVWVDGELLAYRDATLTALARYSLAYLRRRLYGTTSPLHAAGAPWMRLDSALLKLPVAAGDVGTTVYIKVTSRNALGTYVQGLAEVAAQPVLLASNASAPAAVQGLALTAPFVSNYFEVNWLPTARATDYEVQVLDGLAVVQRTVVTSATVYRYTSGDAVDDGGAERSYTVRVVGRNAVGSGTPATLAISNPAPAITTGVAAAGTGTSRTISWAASAATDLAGYQARFSTTTGFNPALGAGTEFYRGSALSGPLTGLTLGTTYYVRVAAFDVWSANAADLSWSAQISFTA